MKITVAPREVADAVAGLARFVNPRPSVPVLGGILLEAVDDQLVLSVFDYDVTCRAAIPAKVDEPGRALVPARVLIEVAKNLPSQPVELALSGNEVTIAYGAARAAVSTLPIEDFPTLPELPQPFGEVDGSLLKAAAAQVVPVANQHSAEPALRCVQLDILGDQFTLAAADSPRVAARVLEWTPQIPGGEHALLLPASLLHEVARGAGPWPVSIGLGDGIISFAAAGRTATVRLVDARFPQYRRFLDLDFAITATADTGGLLEATRRVALFAEKDAPIRLDFTEGAVTVRAGSDVGRGSEAVAVDLQGEDVEVAFLAPFLLDALAAIAAEHDTVCIAMNGPGKPVQLTGAVDDPAFRCTVMALRVA